MRLGLEKILDHADVAKMDYWSGEAKVRPWSGGGGEHNKQRQGVSPLASIIGEQTPAADVFTGLALPTCA